MNTLRQMIMNNLLRVQKIIHKINSIMNLDLLE